MSYRDYQTEGLQKLSRKIARDKDLAGIYTVEKEKNCNHNGPKKSMVHDGMYITFCKLCGGMRDVKPYKGN